MRRERFEIRLPLHGILEQIDRYSYYTGNARHEAGTPARMAAAVQSSADDRKQMESHIGAAIGEAAQMINRYLANCRQASEEDIEHEGYSIVTLNYRPPYYFPEEANSQLAAHIERYIVMRTIQLWMQQVRPEESVISATEAEKETLQMRQAMAVRIKPRRKRNNPDTRVEI